MRPWARQPVRRQPVRVARRVALLGVLALASYLFLPYAHLLSGGCGPAACSSDAQSASHSTDCSVCGALAHAGARAVDAPVALALAHAPLTLRAAVHVASECAPVRERAPACARAPPASFSG